MAALLDAALYSSEGWMEERPIKVEKEVKAKPEKAVEELMDLSVFLKAMGGDVEKAWGSWSHMDDGASEATEPVSPPPVMSPSPLRAKKANAVMRNLSPSRSGEEYSATDGASTTSAPTSTGSHENDSKLAGADDSTISQCVDEFQKAFEAFRMAADECGSTSSSITSSPTSAGTRDASSMSSSPSLCPATSDDTAAVNMNSFLLALKAVEGQAVEEGGRDEEGNDVNPASASPTSRNNNNERPAIPACTKTRVVNFTKAVYSSEAAGSQFSSNKLIAVDLDDFMSVLNSFSEDAGNDDGCLEPTDCNGGPGSDAEADFLDLSEDASDFF